MAIKQLNPYLSFDGTASDAITFYERALGAKVEEIRRLEDVPGRTPAPDDAKRVIHAVLRVGPHVLMMCDMPPGTSAPSSGKVHLSLDFDEVQDMTQRFEALAAGGTITQPLHDAFWGARFGIVTDAFGVSWMFNCATNRG